MTNEEMNWFLRGGKRPDPAPKAPVVCQNCGGDNLADEEQCTHCGALLQGGTTAEEYCGGDADKVCPECGNCWPLGYERCPACQAVLRVNDGGPTSKEYLVRVSQVKKCLWKGYVKVKATSRLAALVKARDEFEYDGLDAWDLADPDLGSDDGSDDEPVFTIEEPEA